MDWTPYLSVGWKEQERGVATTTSFTTWACSHTNDCAIALKKLGFSTRPSSASALKRSSTALRAAVGRVAVRSGILAHSFMLKTPVTSTPSPVSLAMKQ